LSLFYLWLANKIPNFFKLKLLKASLLYFSGIKLNCRDFYFISPLLVDNPSSLYFGRRVFINSGVKFEGVGRVTLGNNIQVGPNVVFATTNHELPSMKTSAGSIELKDDVWIGSNAVIMAGVVLGPNLIVGAGAVVNKSFSNCIIGGVPARKLKDIRE
jgi:acetyltransferase-like isoleucine patch superfamily enzyme